MLQVDKVIFTLLVLLLQCGYDFVADHLERLVELLLLRVFLIKQVDSLDHTLHLLFRLLKDFG